MWPTPIFYSYAYPEPDRFNKTKIEPAAASYNAQLHEFTLPYDEVRDAADPDATILAFARSTYDAAANLGGWDRQALTEIKPQLRSATLHR